MKAGVGLLEGWEILMVCFWALLLAPGVYDMVRRMDDVRWTLPLVKTSLVGRVEFGLDVK